MIRLADVSACDVCFGEMDYYEIFMKRRARLCKSLVSATVRSA